MNESIRRPLIHSIYDSPVSGECIESLSFSAIDNEAPDHPFSADPWEIVRRMIHTTADFGIIPSVRFSDGAIASAVEALCEARPLYMDSNMVRAGLSMARLRGASSAYGPGKLLCHVSDSDVADEAQRAGLPRAVFSVRKAMDRLHGSIALFGNSPVGLLELNRLIVEENIRPALVVGMPVGFVHVMESKEELAILGVPYIILSGRRGGSPLAVSVVHALCGLAARKKGGSRLTVDG